MKLIPFYRLVGDQLEVSHLYERHPSEAEHGKPRMPPLQAAVALKLAAGYVGEGNKPKVPGKP